MGADRGGVARRGAVSNQKLEQGEVIKMAEQLSFDGFGPPGSPPAPSQRRRELRGFVPGEPLFFAIHLVGTAAGQSIQLAHELIALQSEKAKPHRVFHCTLLSLGDFTRTPEVILDALVLAGARVAVPAFETTWDYVMRFGRETDPIGPLVLRPGDGEAELHALFEAICLSVEAVLPGFRARRSFVPHVILARTAFYFRAACRAYSLGRPRIHTRAQHPERRRTRPASHLATSRLR